MVNGVKSDKVQSIALGQGNLHQRQTDLLDDAAEVCLQYFIHLSQLRVHTGQLKH